MTKNLASLDKGSELGQFMAALRSIGGRAYLLGGPVFGLVVIALFTAGFALSAVAMWFSRAEHTIGRRDGVSTPAKL